MQILPFKSSAELRRWLGKHHAESEGIWMRIFKKDSGEKSVTYAEALDQALCFGWIDGLKKSFDEVSWIQKFTPRRTRSVWSKLNTQHAERLIKAGAMTAAGLKVIEEAKADGRWGAAYDSPKNAAPPEDFLRELAKNRKAEAFFKSLNRVNVYSIVFRLQTARNAETRARRLELILSMMEEGKMFHP